MMRPVLALVFVASLSASIDAQQLVILVRHAERADGGAGASNSMTGTPADPPLSAAGEARAAKLAAMLADAGIKAIYTTEYKRTQQTARPLADKLGLTIRSLTSKDVSGLVARIRAGNARDTVLVIGHSNSIPAAIKALGGPDVKIADDEYTGIYLFAPATGALTVIRY